MRAAVLLLREAAAVIASYGTLADGTTPRPKQRVYFPPGYCEHDNDGVVHLAVSYEGGFAPLKDAYSTEQAAKAAKEEL